MLDDTLLDDPGRLAEVDAEGLLRAAAMAGAQVRATAEAAGEFGLDRLRGTRPRAVLLLTRPGVSQSAVRVLLAILQPVCPAPVVVTDIVPSWIGPLDVVIAHTDDPGDHVLAESIDRAVRYGATVMLTAPSEGPVAAAGGGRAILLPPRLPVPPGFRFPRAFTAGLIVANAAGLLSVDLNNLADELDREAEKDHLQHESFVNPAKALALRLAEHTPLLWGLDDVATAVTRHAASVLASQAAVVADASGYQQATTKIALHRAAVQSTTSGEDIFADPDLDGPQGGGLRVVLVEVRSDERSLAARRAATEALPGTEVLSVAEEVTGDDATRAAVIALRFELAALYLGLAAGTIGDRAAAHN
ncbi:SIS domain-containing protein [Labedaea rhizosphaerae]|uniref:SIS domain-containing protein n=1 Tax=Labedaea rhizosphaerae TaxID=598644 RepID=UPI001061FFB2|nr:SIS domain-containing protein [Labedaea rhizosphaerae]